MNIIQLQGSRIKPKSGDIFVYQRRSEPRKYWYGRVISTTAKTGGLPGNFNLVYILNIHSESKDVSKILPANEYLIPPRCTNNQLWLKGYFTTIGNREFWEGERFSVHQFKDFGENAKIFDENGNIIKTRKNGIPVGMYGLDSYATIDEDIEDRLAQKRIK
jgi:hypothetical protein